MNPEIITLKDNYGDGFVRVYYSSDNNKYCLVVDTDGRIKNMGIFDEENIKLEIASMLEKWDWGAMKTYWNVDKGESILYDHWDLMPTDDTDALIMW